MQINRISTGFNYMNDLNQRVCNEFVNKASFPKNNISFKSYYDTFNPYDIYDPYEDEEADDSILYYQDEIRLAKQNMDIKDKGERLRKTADSIHYDLLHHRAKEDKEDGLAFRIALAIVSSGASEYLSAKEKHNFPKVAQNKALKLELIRGDLLNARNSEEVAQKDNENAVFKRKYEYLQALEDIKENELRPQLINLIKAKASGADVEMPNCIMISGKDYATNSAIVDWCKANVDANVSVIDADFDDIVEALEEAQSTYKETGVWNVIHVKNMDKLIRSGSPQVASMKKLMCKTASKFHTTLLFTSEDPNRLDPIAIEVNRVTSIDTNGVPDVKEMTRRDIEKRLENKEYIKKSPLTAINDILELAGIENCERLTFKHSTRSDLQKINDNSWELLYKLPNEKRIKYSLVIQEAIKNAWYIV